MILTKIRATACAAFWLAAFWRFPDKSRAHRRKRLTTPCRLRIRCLRPHPRRLQEKSAGCAQRKTLGGFWKLNTDESDDPRTKLDAARQTKAKSGNDPGGPGGPGNGGGRVGIGFPAPGGGNGPMGGGGTGRGLGGCDTDAS